MTVVSELTVEVAAEAVFVDGCLRPWLRQILAAERQDWSRLGAAEDELLPSLAEYLEGGKALRPRFCFWGHAAVSGTEWTDDLMAAGGALELLHAFALIHDDLMDGSDTRRGRPALHQTLADHHRNQDWAGPADRYGSATALLAGDLAFALANRLVSELPAAARRVWHRLVAELTAGQYLDLAGSARRDHSTGLARTVARLKSGRYTVSGPLQLGAAVAGGELNPAVIRFGELIGEAFQLRDDLLGTFGDPARTGKPIGEDLRSGKPTLLVAYAVRRAPAADRNRLAKVGIMDLDDVEVAELAALLDRCGARTAVESRIDYDLEAAKRLLQTAAIPTAVADAMLALAEKASHRHE